MKYLVILLSSVQVWAEGTTNYYIGEATTTINRQVSHQPYLVARTIDQTSRTISEAVVSYGREGFSENSTVFKVDPNRFSINTGGTSGKGELFGEPWNWSFLRAEFKVESNDLKIVDYNIFSTSGTVVGHKDFYRAGQLFMKETVVLNLTDKATYDAKRAGLLKKN
jgi:hypothetical protein